MVIVRMKTGHMMKGIVATEAATEVATETTATAYIATAGRHRMIAKVARAAIDAARAYLHGCMATAAKAAAATAGCTAAAPGATSATTVAKVLCITA